MLRDAALLQLRVTREASKADLALKDATPYNVQWRGARPVFIDVGSFERAARRRAVARLPPVLHAVPLSAAARGLQGHPVPAVAAREPRGHPPVGGEVAAQGQGHPPRRRVQARRAPREARAKPRRRDERRPEGAPRGRLREGADRGQPQGSAKSSSKVSAAPVARPSGATTARRAATRTRTRGRRRSSCALRCSRQPRSLVWDLGANDGRYSRIAAEGSAYTIALDVDHGVVDRLYRALAEEDERTILPLVGDIADPSPGLGWRGRERAAAC